MKITKPSFDFENIRAKIRIRHILPADMDNSITKERILLTTLQIIGLMNNEDMLAYLCYRKKETLSFYVLK